MRRSTVERVLVLLLGATVAGPVAAQALSDCRQQSAALLAAVKAGDYGAAEKDFSDRMKQAASPAMLKAAIEQQLAARLGSLQTIGDGTAETIDNTTVVSTPLHGDRGSLLAKVSCDASGKVGGFHLLPAQVPAATSTYTLPAYADSNRYHETAAAVGPLALGATLSLPNGTGPFPAVVLVQGSGPHDRDETIGPNRTFADLAAGLASAGIAVLRYDKRTYGHPDRVAAKPDFTLDDEVTDDAVAAVDLLRATPGVDPKRVFVLGHSLGGLLAPRIALHSPKVAGLVLFAAPAAPFEDSFLRQRRYLADLDGTRDDREKKMLADAEASIVQLHHLLAGEPITGPLPYAESGIRAPYLLDWARLDPVADAKKAAKPMLILQGDHDYQVSPATDFSRWQAAFDTHPQVTLILYPGLSHLFRPAGDPPSPADYRKAAAVDPKVVADIARWINGLH